LSRIRQYIHHWIDNRHGKAKARYFFRRRGFRQIALPGAPGTPQFEEGYQAALGGAEPVASSIRAKRVRAGTLDALIIAYMHVTLPTLAPSTGRVYRGILERFAAEHGAKPLAGLTRKHIEAMLAKKATKPAAANNWLQQVKALTSYGAREGLLSHDPARDIAFLRRKSPGIYTWSEGDIAAFEARHPVGSKARLALGLLLYTAQRRGDVLVMGKPQVRDGVVHVRQQKTGKTLAIPLHPALQAILDATPCEHLTFLTTAHGKPFAPGGFSNWFRDRVLEGPGYPGIAPPTGYARRPLDVSPKPDVRPTSSLRSRDTRPSRKSPVIPPPPIRSGWPARAWRR
jgi:integrase